MAAASSFTTGLEAKLAKQLRSQRVGYPWIVGARELHAALVEKHKLVDETRPA